MAKQVSIANDLGLSLTLGCESGYYHYERRLYTKYANGRADGQVFIV